VAVETPHFFSKCLRHASLGRYITPLRQLAAGHDTCSLPLFCPITMLFTWKSKSILLQLLLFDATVIQSLSSKPIKPEFVTLPTLREQAVIQDAWTEQRKANIPNILNKYGVDAWLVRASFLSVAAHSSSAASSPDQVVLPLQYPQTLRGVHDSNN